MVGALLIRKQGLDSFVEQCRKEKSSTMTSVPLNKCTKNWIRRVLTVSLKKSVLYMISIHRKEVQNILH